MKVIAFALLLLIASSEVSAFSLTRSEEKKENPFDQLEELSKTSNFAEGLVSTIQLHLQSNNEEDPVTATVNIVKKALQDQNNKHGALVKERDAKLNAVSDKVLAQSKLVLDLGKRTRATLLQITQLGDTISKLNKAKKTFEGEIKDLEKKDGALTKAHEADAKAFKKRQARNAKAVKALGEIVPELGKLLKVKEKQAKHEKHAAHKKSAAKQAKAKAKAEKQAKKKVKNMLLQLADHQELASLVQVSSSLNPTKLKFVIKKLVTIKKAIQLANQDDVEKQKQSDKNFQSIKKSIVKSLTLKRAQLKVTEKGLRKGNSALAREKRKRDSFVSQSKLANANLNIKKQQFEQQTKMYKKRVSNSTDAINALELCLQILTKGSKDLKEAGKLLGKKK